MTDPVLQTTAPTATETRRNAVIASAKRLSACAAEFPENPEYWDEYLDALWRDVDCLRPEEVIRPEAVEPGPAHLRAAAELLLRPPYGVSAALVSDWLLLMAERRESAA